MKNLIKITVICSLFIAACFMITACGGDAENFVQGNGQIDVTVKDGTSAFVPNVRIDVKDPGGATVTSSTTTVASTIVTFQLTVGKVYTFTFTDVAVPVRFVTQSITAEPLLTATVNVNAVMQPVP